MNAISNVLTYAIPHTDTRTQPILSIALFCCFGLVTSIAVALAGFDLSVGSY